MFLLNLSLAEFLAIFGAVAAVVVALYLLDRSRQRQTVASLRFWRPSERPAERRSRRRRIQQPLSLLLQLLSIACLLLALSQLRLGVRESSGRDHVLILDTSAWMEASAGSGRLIDQAHSLARRWLWAIPSADRVMVVRANALATPATGFENNRQKLEEAITGSQPGGTALDIGKALELARQVQRLHSSRPGDIVFSGAGRVAEHEGEPLGSVPNNLRVLPVEGAVDNRGLRRIGLQRSVADPGIWEVFVTVRNDSRLLRGVDVSLQFGGAPLGMRRLDLPPTGEGSVTFKLRTRAAGWVEVRLLGTDGFPADDRAVLELPAQRVLRVLVYSDQPDWLRPVLAANPNVEARFYRPSEYGAHAGEAEIMILDRFAPARPPAVDSIWIEPPEGGAPLRVVSRVTNTKLTRWHSEYRLAEGLRTEDLRLQSAEVFATAPGDMPIAEVEQGPVIVARSGKPRTVVLGFHPMRTAMRYELAAPLLFANILRWMSPELFRRWELNAGSVGSVAAPMDPEADPSQVRVVAEDQTPLPFTVQDGHLRFFTGVSGTVRVLAGDREMVYSLTLPETGGAAWAPPESVPRGIPARAEIGASARDVWEILAILGALGLLVDWLLYGRSRAAALSERPRSLFHHLLRRAS